MKEMFHLLSSMSGAKEVKTIFPVPVANVIAVISGIASKITGKPSRMTTYAVYNLARNNEFNCDKARRELGFKVRPFADTISDLISWLRAEGKIRDLGNE
jgi:dihydroflavonol-4-reductase